MPIRLGRAARGLAACGLLLVVPAGAHAQLSPGPLSAAHAALEGTSHCLDCHQSGRGVPPEKCLACHGEIARRMAAGRGPHARPEYADCRTCHVEHHGRDYALVWWGEGGASHFDHATTGWPLSGAHARLACRSCHRPELIRDRESLGTGGRNPAATFLGLATACVACHADVHGGTLGTSSCEACHGLDAWRPASRFDHQASRFPLFGRHREVPCGRCHPRQEEAGSAGAATTILRLAGLRFARCSDCHEDPHRGRQGELCAACHTPEGWNLVAAGRFDHARSRFPLSGRHRQVACSGCHRTSGTFRVAAFARCADCHSDPHAGQFASREDGGVCESCHTVDGFTPSTFGFARHQTTSFPLEGAHRAVPCDGCHRPEPVSETRAAGPTSPPVVRYRLGRPACSDCHADPHRGEVDRYLGQSGCASCHSTVEWVTVRFEHAATRFPLGGAHAKLACAACHRRVDVGTPHERIRLTGLPLSCSGCHRDPHGGQFDRAGAVAECRRCHQDLDWKPTSFDHDRDARFHLEGAHRAVPCAGCHPREGEGEAAMVRFRPRPTACADCHAGHRAGGGRRKFGK